MKSGRRMSVGGSRPKKAKNETFCRDGMSTGRSVAKKYATTNATTGKPDAVETDR